MIRRATIEDMPHLLVMGEQFAAYAPHRVEYSPEGTAASLSSLMDVGVILVNEIDGEIAGALVGMIAPFWYAPSSSIAVELAWWVDPKYRGGGSASRLVKAFEQWGQENGASAISLCDMRHDDEFPAGPLFERMGYRLTERTHIKEL